ncbi:UdgX family uracil-DNA binding protein [Ramlibacter sp. AW1]|uniref:Type-4 uracil-DNA glycosylase n=1 Tax=Ramlibacter aurantiacus TaxID=2801330 RepID=A0A936ZJU4_9BURK|nr:UdgX family uracil-DNA binding protein [Ramlibacter aurantiacus]MBL0422664.1 UdgX family uracil-DNA binding protein [Ramlibacter aurantiacus]
MATARLAHETDLAGFRREARRLVAQGMAPHQVSWSVGAADDDLFAHSEPSGGAATGASTLAVPAAFLALCEQVVLHRDPQRFALLYRLLWRLLHEPGLRDDPLDADRLQLARMAKAVQRDMHKMRAFVRFRTVDRAGDARGPLHVAWFEPGHRITAANGPWFQRRFANMHWAILTPDCCLDWDGQRLQVRGGAARADAPAADAGEALWLTYYRSIFNPARLNLPVMQQEMPRRYWRNLPEAQAIAPLAAAAAQRTAHMIDAAPSASTPRIPIWSAPAPERPAAGTLAELAHNMQHCRDCPIGASATQAVCGEGPLQAAVMFVGEQPGDQEDLRGRPFVGPAGQLLDRALQQAGIARESAYLTNAVRHFKHELRGKRRLHKTPSQQEALACRHWLEEEIALVRPRAIVALGATAARSLLGRPVAVMSERGRWHERPDGLRVLVTVHPSSLLRLPAEQMAQAFEAFVEDLRRVSNPLVAQ